MSPETYSLEELAQSLGRDSRELERLVSRGRIPGRKVSGTWTFHAAEIAQGIASEMRRVSDGQLAQLERSHRSRELQEDLPVTTLLPVEHVAVPLEARTKRSVIEQLVQAAGQTWKIWEPAAVVAAVREREELLSTAMEAGVAMPHARQPMPDVLEDSVIAFGRTLSGIPFGAPDNSLTDLFFLIVCRDTRTHLHVLARLGRMLRRPGFIDELRAAPDAVTAHAVITEADLAIG